MDHPVEHLSQSSRPRRAPRKVQNACQRCRRQKLKCDIQRPCTLCLRAGVDCEPGSSDRWKTYQPNQNQHVTTPGSRRKRIRIESATPERAQPSPSQTHDDRVIGSVLEEHRGMSHEGDETPVPSTDRAWNSSSTMLLVKSAFQFHNVSTLGTSITNAFPGGQRREADAHSATEGVRSSHTPSVSRPFVQTSRSSVIDLARLFPRREAAALLVDTYFDRVHWFVLIFHQDEFRTRWQKLYEQPIGTAAPQYENVGFISTFLMVIAIGLQYASGYRRSLLTRYGVEPDTLKEEIFTALRAKLLDFVSLGSLEAAQTCVLLGTYYLYHGNPGLAWPICGCALRIAQALGLHRKLGGDNPHSTQSRTLRRQNEARKRCWWAVYEIETFCSMSYGYPHSIKDADCDIEPLDPSAKLSHAQSPSSFDEPLQGETTLLSYKYFMSKLSVLTKAALTELYGVSQEPADNRKHGSNRRSTLRQLIRKVMDFDARLRQWQAEIPSKLQLRTPSSTQPGYSSVEELDRDIGASGPRFETHIYQLQAFALELAYENARILVHRPLLSFKMIARPSEQHDSTGHSSSSSDPFRFSLQACREAALRTSELHSLPIFKLASDTYAAAFVGIHTFTAGVTLCILTSIEPLSLQSHESKIGLRRLMAMQMRLKDKSILAAQGLDLLQRLTKLVMTKELNEMLDLSETEAFPCAAAAAAATVEPARFSSSSSSRPLDGIIQSVPPDLATPVTSLLFPEQQQEQQLPDPALVNGFDYIENPAMSQALSDFDQAISSYAPPYRQDLGDESLFSNVENGFAGQEQAWIWGFDYSQQCATTDKY